MKTMTRLLAVLAVLAFAGWVGAASAVPIYDVADDFSLSNPNGVWSYGSANSLVDLASGSFTQFTDTTTAFLGISGVQSHYSVIDLPAVFKNTTSGTVYPAGTVTLAPGQLALHPGQGGELSVIRWTAPTVDDYGISSVFEAIGGLNTSTDVHILHNGISIFDGSVLGSGGPLTSVYSGNISFLVGDTLDFAVGFGGNGYNFDSTALDAQITPPGEVPLPAAAWLFGSALLGLGALKRKKA